MNKNAKCSAFVNWTACGILYKNHDDQKIGHKFQSRIKHKSHIKYSNDYVYCGWPMWMVTELVNAHGNAIRAATHKNSMCQSCLKQYVFLNYRGGFLNARV